jgi:hypothetical protein
MMQNETVQNGIIQYVLAKVEIHDNFQFLIIKNGKSNDQIRLDTQDGFTPIYYTFGDKKTEKQVKNFVEQ